MPPWLLSNQSDAHHHSSAVRDQGRIRKGTEGDNDGEDAASKTMSDDIPLARDSQLKQSRSRYPILNFFNSLGRHHRKCHSNATTSDDRRVANPTPATLRFVIESPPCVLYGTPATSSGALLTGRLQVVVEEPLQADSLGVFGSKPLIIDQVGLQLVRVTATSKGVKKNCADCNMLQQDIFSCDFLTEPTHLRSGVHDFPFSYLLPGDLPTTTISSLGTVRYLLVATMQTVTGKGSRYLSHPLRISRSVIPGKAKAFVRVFPPTKLAARVVLPSVIHPIGGFSVQLSLTGAFNSSQTAQARWQLRKLTWKIEERQILVSTACPRHVSKLDDNGCLPACGTKTVGQGEEKTGWKSVSGATGEGITFLFEASMCPGSGVLCDTFSGGYRGNRAPVNSYAVKVRHTLILELTVAEECQSSIAQRQGRPTDAVRVLRMQLNIAVTEPPGMGISWDKERPPIYEDVSESPPLYSHERGSDRKTDNS